MFIITKFRQVISVILFALSSLSNRDTLDIDRAFVSTTVCPGSEGVPFNLDKTAV